MDSSVTSFGTVSAPWRVADGRRLGVLRDRDPAHVGAPPVGHDHGRARREGTGHADQVEALSPAGAVRVDAGDGHPVAQGGQHLAGLLTPVDAQGLPQADRGRHGAEHQGPRRPTAQPDEHQGQHDDRQQPVLLDPLPDEHVCDPTPAAHRATVTSSGLVTDGGRRRRPAAAGWSWSVQVRLRRGPSCRGSRRHPLGQGHDGLGSPSTSSALRMCRAESRSRRSAPGAGASRPPRRRRRPWDKDRLAQAGAGRTNGPGSSPLEVVPQQHRFGATMPSVVPAATA